MVEIIITKGFIKVYYWDSFVLNTYPIEMDDDFVEYVELLVQYIFSRNMLVTKQMNGREMKGKDLMMYMKVRCFLYFQLKLVCLHIRLPTVLFHSTFCKPLADLNKES